MATNSSIIVSDEARNLYAYGYQHDTGVITYRALFDSALETNKDWEASEETEITPEEFLAEWHKLSLKSWDHPSHYGVAAVEELAEIAKSDDSHYDIEMKNGFVTSITEYVAGREILKTTFTPRAK